ncbi:hypothetical protein CEXT_234941 [Caerostris extrusa]|uniref:Uncharacterized protein n=1 Tax=Caerostris extrusa TaxID=172846 RepID=A0AAV4N494_CAEEX|nr:hypothetical protein CEXT_234941 [Caerostris extrusa]
MRFVCHAVDERSCSKAALAPLHRLDLLAAQLPKTKLVHECSTNLARHVPQRLVPEGRHAVDERPCSKAVHSIALIFHYTTPQNQITTRVYHQPHSPRTTPPFDERPCSKAVHSIALIFHCATPQNQITTQVYHQPHSPRTTALGAGDLSLVSLQLAPAIIEFSGQSKAALDERPCSKAVHSIALIFPQHNSPKLNYSRVYRQRTTRLVPEGRGNEIFPWFLYNFALDYN